MHKETERTVVCSETPKKCFPFFEEMKNKEEFCDVRFQIGSETISAHRIIIAAAIPYFRAKWSSKDGKRYEVGAEMADVEPSAFKCLIEFAYSFQVKIDTENVRNLLTAACCLGVDEVREACCDFLVDNLEPQNVLNIREYAHDLKCSDLLKHIDSYFKENFKDVSQTKDFLNCSLTLLKEVIREDDLNVENEEAVFEAVITWAKYSPEERSTQLPELLRIVRMPLLNPLYLTKMVQAEEVIRSSISCRDLIDEAKNYNLFPELQKGIFGFSTQPRQFIKTTYTSSEQEQEQQCIYILSAQLSLALKQLYLKEEIWLTKGEKKFPINGCPVVELQNKIYYVDWGYSLRYDPATNRSEVFDRVPTPRTNAGAASLEGKIYICGGSVGEIAVSNIVECFDPQKDKWTEVRCMLTGRWGPSVVALGAYLFVLGGQNNVCVYSSVERYDPAQQKWRKMSPTHAKRSFAGAATLNGKIYICGGKTGPDVGERVTSTAEVYDPEANSWTFISCMKTTRYAFTLLSCHKMFYAIEGLDHNRRVVYNFEVYDPENDEWKYCSSIDVRSSGAVVTSASSVSTCSAR